MNGYDAYKVYQAVRLHFTSESFDYFLYNGKTKAATLEAFNLRKDKYSYHKLARVASEEELPFYCAVNFLNDDKCWISNLLEDIAVKRYKEWLSWQQARAHNFKSDLSKIDNHNFAEVIVCKENQLPKLLELYFQHEIGYDTIVILDHYINLVDNWNKKIGDDFIWNSFYKKFKKYKPFFLSYSPLSDPHYKKIIKENLTIHKV